MTKGFKYKMRYVYAHFPINVNLEKNAETGNFEVEIRYVRMEGHPQEYSQRRLEGGGGRRGGEGREGVERVIGYRVHDKRLTLGVPQQLRR